MKACVNAAGLLAGIILAAGCASPDVNPDRPMPHTGYVDFYVEPDEALCWQVMRMDDPTGKPLKLFEQFEPAPDRILRLALAPGPYDLRVTVLNHLVAEPGRLKLEVKDGLITPVRVTLIESGTAQVEFKEARVGGTYYGRFGRGTRIRSRQSGALRLTAAPQEPVPYQPKLKMPYGQSETNNPTGPGNRSP